MSLFKYEDFMLEQTMYELLNESKLYFSRKLIQFLNKIKDDKVAKHLLALYSKDVDKLKFNYVDITDDKARLSFIPDAKAQKIINDRPEIYETISSGRNLTHGPKNDKIFLQLGYEKPDGDPWSPSGGQSGLILNEVISSTSGKTFVVFEEIIDDKGTGGKKTVMNKDNLQLSEEYAGELYTKNRNPINVGRIARAILTSAEVKFVEKDIEEFVNKYKATFDFMQDKLKQFDIVKGNAIAHWYQGDNYVGDGDEGTLSNSCMAYSPSDFFDIYTSNKQVSLVILYSDDGTIKGDKYESDKIKGRAILWDCKVDGVDAKFLDRIYTNHDSDTELFKQFAEKNEWFCKKRQSMTPSETISDGNVSKSRSMVAKLDYTNFDYYPYMDTMCYITLGSKEVRNESSGCDRIARDTDGDYHDDDDY